MSAEALRGVILVWDWLGTGYLLVDAERWTVGIRVVHHLHTYCGTRHQDTLGEGYEHQRR
nr:MAG: hypothetical protein [Bacteriophage sp.]